MHAGDGLRSGKSGRGSGGWKRLSPRSLVERGGVVGSEAVRGLSLEGAHGIGGGGFGDGSG
jgi:hypothetical protein